MNGTERIESEDNDDSRDGMAFSQIDLRESLRATVEPPNSGGPIRFVSGALCAAAVALLVLGAIPESLEPDLAQMTSSEPVVADIAILSVPREDPVFPAQPECVAEMESRLDGLMATAEAPWTTNEAAINDLNQLAVNCPEAGMEFRGDLELIGLGFADLWIAWDRSDFALTLTAVAKDADDAIAQRKEETQGDNLDGRWLNIVLDTSR